MLSLSSILAFYLTLSFLAFVAHTFLHWVMYKRVAKVHTDCENEKRQLEREYGFISPKEMGRKLESYQQGLITSLIADLFRSPIDLPLYLYSLAGVFLGVLQRYSPDEMIPPEEIAQEFRGRNREKLARYEGKLIRWKEEERMKGSTKYVWSSPAPVPR